MHGLKNGCYKSSSIHFEVIADCKSSVHPTVPFGSNKSALFIQTAQTSNQQSTYACSLLREPQLRPHALQRKGSQTDPWYL